MINYRILGAFVLLALFLSDAHSAVVTMNPNPITSLSQGAYVYELELVSADSNTNIFRFDLNLVQASTTGQGVAFTFVFDQSIVSSSVVNQGGYYWLSFSNPNYLSVGVQDTATAGITGTIEFTLSATPHTLDVTPYFGTVKSATFSAVPIPGAAWLFGSGLLGLIGMARRMKAA